MLPATTNNPNKLFKKLTSAIKIGSEWDISLGKTYQVRAKAPWRHFLLALLLLPLTAQAGMNFAIESGYLIDGNPIKKFVIKLIATPIEGESDWSSTAAENKVISSLELVVGLGNKRIRYQQESADGSSDPRFVATIDKAYYQDIAHNKDGRHLKMEITVTDISRSGEAVANALDENGKLDVQLNFEGLSDTASLKVEKYYPIAAPEITTQGEHETVVVNWATDQEKVDHFDLSDADTLEKVSLAPTEVSIWLIPLEDENPDGLHFTGKTIIDSESITCPLTIENDSCHVTCEEGFLTAMEDIPNADQKSATYANGSLAFSGLKQSEDGTIPRFAVVGSYLNGLTFSCLLASPEYSVTLTEYNGLEEHIKEGNPNCFIATAAYGTFDDHKLNNLRWFRDRYLLSFPLGRQFVHYYYQYSPPLADRTRNSQGLKTLVQWLLLPPVVMIGILRNVSESSSMQPWVSFLVLGLGFLLFQFKWRQKQREPAIGSTQ